MDLQLLDCNDPSRPPKHDLRIKLKKDDSPKEVVRDQSDDLACAIHVCIGDTVTWKQSKKEFKIGFKDDSNDDGVVDTKDSPFEWTELDSGSGKVVVGTIRGDAAGSVHYKYTVAIPGTPDPELDPIIIVDR